jgi:hypothetical protein
VLWRWEMQKSKQCESKFPLFLPHFSLLPTLFSTELWKHVSTSKSSKCLLPLNALRQSQWGKFPTVYLLYSTGISNSNATQPRKTIDVRWGERSIECLRTVDISSLRPIWTGWQGCVFGAVMVWLYLPCRCYVRKVPLLEVNYGTAVWLGRPLIDIC